MSPPSTLDMKSPYVAGIGASAGGLAALKLMLEHLPAKTGVAFVLIQHLPADHRSALVELLRPAAKTRVSEAADGTVVEPDHFYVCPANANIALEDGVIRLVPLTDAQRGHMSIDSFFYSLARGQQRRAVAVVLSGTGSDGAAGLRAVKAAGGLTFAQDPETAQYDGMPRSAIETGCVDFVLSVPEIACALSRVTVLPAEEDSEEKAAESTADHPEDTRRILHILKDSTNIDFSHYKPATIGRRVGRRTAVYGLDGVGAYADHLRTHPVEMEALTNDLLIGVTEFFRDPSAFEALAASVYPAFAAGLIRGPAGPGVGRRLLERGGGLLDRDLFARILPGRGGPSDPDLRHRPECQGNRQGPVRGLQPGRAASRFERRADRPVFHTGRKRLPNQ